MGRARNPFRGLIDHMSEMTRMREYAEGGGQAQEDQRRTHATAWVPTTDIFARRNDLVIRCELAGVYQDDIDITVANGVLSVSGERRSELEGEVWSTRGSAPSGTSGAPSTCPRASPRANRRRIRERPAGDHHRGRGQPAGAPARPGP
jgi:hypothetical protein